MKNLCVIIAIFIFSLYSQAQPAKTPETNNAAKPKETKQKKETVAKKIEDSPKTDDPKKTSALAKFNLPPEKLNPVKIPKIETPIVIDGRPDEEIWKQSFVFKDFYQVSPGNNVAPSKPTEVMMVYDERHLYIAFKCWDEKDKIRATVARRDAVTGEDNVRVWLDTYDDQRRAYIFAFNPFGIQQDGIFTEGQGDDYSVDVVMESKGVIEDWGWSVEVKIPFKSLRYTAGKGKMWGFNVARNIDRFNDEFDQWLPDDRDISGFLIKHGKIAGLDEIKYERTLEIVPSVTISETGSRVRRFPRYLVNQFGYFDPVNNPNGLPETGRFVNQPIKQDIGVSVKYTITPNITLDATYNPDFAEIEADAPVVTANQRFPIFFQEKRPFFLEGAEIFQSPLRIFHSRTIVDPDFAAKLTGKVGKTSFGFLAASDKAPGNYGEDDRNDPSVRPRIDEFVDKNALFAILRLKRDFGKENNIGFFATYRGFPENKNLLAAIDGRFKFNPKLTSQFQVIGTNSRKCFFDPEFEPSESPLQAQRNREICGGGTFGNITLFGSPFNQYRTGNGVGYYASLDYTTEKHGWFAEVGGRSKDYRADAGFTPRTNTNFAFFLNRFSTKSNPKAKIINARWAQMSGVDYDWSGRVQGFSAQTNVNLSLQKNTFVSAQAAIGYEKLYEEEFGLKRSPTRANPTFFGAPTRSSWQQWYSVNINQTPHKRFNYGAFVGMINNAFDFDFGAERFSRVSPAYLQYLIDRQTNPNLDEPPLDPGVGRQYDAEVFMEYKPTDPLRVSLSYRKSILTRNDTGRTAFDTNIFSLRSTYQFSRFTFTRLRFDYDTLSRNASGQLLFGWNPNPGTAFYVGYNDNFNYAGFNPFTGNHEPRFERNGRTFFIRASYLFRKSF